MRTKTYVPWNGSIVLAVLLATAGCNQPAPDPGDAGPPPSTRVEVVIDTLHGVAIADPYRWLEAQDTPETRDWIARQNAYTHAALDQHPSVEPLRRRLGELRRIDRTGTRVHERNGRFFVWKKRAEDDLWILHVRHGLRGDDEVLIDPHQLSDDHTVDIELLDISRDGGLLAYGLREGGVDEIAVRILDVDRRVDLPTHLPAALYTNVSFIHDTTGAAVGFVYGLHDRRHGTRVYELDLSPGSTPIGPIFGEGYAPDHWISPVVSADGRYILVVVYHGWARSELHVKNRSNDGPVETIVDDIDAMFQPLFAGDRILVLTDWQAPNRRVLSIDPADPRRESWRELVPAAEDPLEDFAVAGGRLFLHYLHDVTSRLEMRSVAGGSPGGIELPGPGTATVPSGSWEGGSAFYSFASFTTPRTVFRLDVETGEVEIWGRDDVRFAPEDYVVEQVWYESKDGTRVPMFIVHRRDLELPGPHPTVLYGYGGFNVSELPRFSTMTATWIEHGGIYALANIRGGGEFGEAWHRAGMLEKKQNVFDDFIAAAEWLIGEGYTSPEKLAIWGGSNGGLLVGAALTQRPDLYQAVLCDYPDLDMLGYYRFPDMNAPALAEYGDASNPDHFEFLRAYSPYQKVADGVAYPAVLFTTGDADTRVPPLQARKMTARLQGATSSDRPIMLLYDTSAGHSGGQPLSKQIEDSALRLAFLCWQLGLEIR